MHTDHSTKVKFSSKIAYTRLHDAQTDHSKKTYIGCDL